MSSPLPQVPQILPRQPGETTYAYRNRRSIALTGESVYQRRIRQAQARGLSITEARGHQAGEYQTRRERTLERYGLTPYQFWRNNQIQWLQANGFYPNTTGWSWNKLVNAAPKMRYMNEKLSVYNRITPELLADAVDFGDSIGDSQWAPERLNEHYADIYEYYEHNDPTNARLHFFRDREPDVSVQWWYYR